MLYSNKESKEVLREPETETKQEPAQAEVPQGKI
jgi:hypothetical protein